MSIATLLSQHHHVTAVDIIPEKVEMINNRKSPIQDDYIEKYLAEKDLDLTATLDAKAAYSNADFVVIAAPTGSRASSQGREKKVVQTAQKEQSEHLQTPDILQRVRRKAGLPLANLIWRAFGFLKESSMSFRFCTPIRSGLR